MAEINKTMNMLNGRLEVLNATLQQLEQTNKGMVKKYEK